LRLIIDAESLMGDKREMTGLETTVREADIGPGQAINSYTFKDLLTGTDDQETTQEIRSSILGTLGQSGINGKTLINQYDCLMSEGIRFIVENGCRCVTSEEVGSGQIAHDEARRQLYEKSLEALFALFIIAKEEHKKQGRLIEFAKKNSTIFLLNRTEECNWFDDHGCNVPRGWEDVSKEYGLMYHLREDLKFYTFEQFMSCLPQQLGLDSREVDEDPVSALMDDCGFKGDALMSFCDRLIELGVIYATSSYPFAVKTESSLFIYHDRPEITVGIDTATNPYPVERRRGLNALLSLYRIAAEEHKKNWTVKGFIQNESTYRLEGIACAYGIDNITGKAVPELKEMHNIIQRLREEY